MTASPAPLRVAINLANTVSARVLGDGTLTGPAVDLAAALGARLAREVEFVRYDGSGQLLSAGDDAWDIAFVAFDPARAAKYHFTRPYLELHATCAVRGCSAASVCAEVDREGARIASVDGTGYGLQLRRAMLHAAIVPCVNFAASAALLASGGVDAVAGVRSSLENWAGGVEARVLADDYAVLGQTIATLRGRRDLVDALEELEREFPSRTRGAASPDAIGLAGT